MGNVSGNRGLIEAKTYRPDVVGMRAFAVLAIIGFDCGIPWLRGGFVGFDIGFVITGYLISSVICKEIQRNSFSIADFYARRCQHTLPALSVVLLFSLGFAVFFLSPWEAYRLGDSAVAASLWASNLLFIIKTSYFADRALTIPLLMTWSLGVQAQFYIAIPLLLLVLGKIRRPSLVVSLLILSSCSFIASVYAEFNLHIWNFYLPVTRAWEFGAGTLLAVWQGVGIDSTKTPSWKTDVTGAAGILMIVASIVFYRPEMRFPGYESLLPVLGSVLLLATPGGRPNRILAARPLVTVGLISYSLYLWHWPLLSFAEILSSKPLRPPTIGILMATAFSAAAVSYFFVEKPFRALTKLKTSQILLTSGAGTVFLAAAGLVFYITEGLPWRNPNLYAIEKEAALYRHYPCISSGSYLRMSVQCAPAPKASMPAMAVLGGGHAEAFAEGLRDFTSKNGWQLVTLTRESCPPTKGVSQWSSSDSTLAASCRVFNRSALDYVRSRPDIRVVVLVGRWRAGFVPDLYTSDPSHQTTEQNAANLKRGLESEVGALESAGKKIIILEDVPEFPYDPVAGIRSQYVPMRRALNRMLLSEEPEQGDGSSEERSLTVTPAAEKVSAQLVALQAADKKLTLIDPKRVLCHGERCYFAGKSDLYYFDSIHLSRSGALRLLPLLPNLKEMQ